MTEGAVRPSDHGDETEERSDEIRESTPLPARVAEDVPEADAIEQAQPVEEEPTTATDLLETVGPEVPEGDALEQAASVPETEDRR